jgi:hypothetical protein
MSSLQVKFAILYFLFVGIASAQVRPNAHPSQITIVTTSASDSVMVNLTVPSDVHLNTLSAHLNGKDVTAKLTPASCAQANCQQATLTASDGLHERKNVFWVIAKRNDGSLVSARTRFAGATATVSARAAIASPQAVHANISASLPTLNDFLPPATAFTTLKFGGYASGSPWFRIGSQNSYPSSPTYSCSGIYTVIVLDRQTLQEKTAPPKNSPNCVGVGDGASLKTYLATLNGGDLVTAEVQASTLQPPPATPVKSKVSAILNLTANVVSTGAALATAGLGIPAETAAIKLALKVLGSASGVTRGTFGMASAITSGLRCSSHWQATTQTLVSF